MQTTSKLLEEQKLSPVTKTTELYNHIELTDEEKEAALLEARKAKHYLIKNQEYWEKVNKEPVYPSYTVEQMRQFVNHKALNRYGFKFEDHNPELLNKLLSYFCNQPGEYDLSKGVLLTGNVGRGKTTLMRLFNENQKGSFIVVSCRKVAQEFAEGGFEAIEKYFGFMNAISNPFGHNTKMGICFDDLGTESDKKNFGNQLNVMAEIILNRYDKQSLKGLTHFTTNLTAEEIEQMYGTRVRSRMREMINKFEITGNDLRK